MRQGIVCHTSQRVSDNSLFQFPGDMHRISVLFVTHHSTHTPSKSNSEKSAKVFIHHADAAADDASTTAAAAGVAANVRTASSRCCLGSGIRQSYPRCSGLDANVQFLFLFQPRECVN